ncbi:MAG: flagellar basal-body rod protein FlgG [Candidatus Magnetobacterium sp. LHC-1]|uniref:Flagellar basal-body rod protein FlgG n=1 Tax=Candidatus Magnetobacterium casense TaxID=1455061 RepID=A0ABS6RV59_9BACT|nr:flagellar basal-body rod protein FlgG [Candidatus Magnetobacterium casensis]MBF0606431.1 flagellar basal-body rod protein FlgG [Nitrospirota bacterium]MBV6340519.1 flagellar basal-body rod protein FlgG [Candidatus Magnetobacterium casensis]
MLRSLFIAATGMNAQKLSIDVVSNNLANVSTYGYKQGRAEFQDLMYQAMKSPGGPTAEGKMSPTGEQIGLGVRTGSIGKIFKQGDFVNTNNELDVAIEGEGFFQITMPDGTVAYTRAGAFKLDSEGKIVNEEGYSLEPELTVPQDTTSLTIGSDGVVKVQQNNQTTMTELGQIELARFVNPAGLRALGKNLYQETEASGTAVVSTPGLQGFGTLAQGFLETSNVSVVDEMVNMIVSQRAYEINSKAVQTSDEMLQLANNMKR